MTTEILLSSHCYWLLSFVPSTADLWRIYIAVEVHDGRNLRLEMCEENFGGFAGQEPFLVDLSI